MELLEYIIQIMKYLKVILLMIKNKDKGYIYIKTKKD